MTAPERRSGVALYTPQILGLAVSLAEYPLEGSLDRRGEAVSRVCGSRVVVALEASPDGMIERIGAQVAACAIGQAAAALFLRSAVGNGRDDVERAAAQLDRWLSGNGPIPDWPELEQLAPAQGYSARHPAILLPWKAALVALSKAGPGG